MDTVSVPLWRILTKNTHACQTSTIETDKRGKIKDFFIYTSPIFILLNERSLGTKVFYYYRIIKQEMVETETSEQSIILNPPSNLKFRTWKLDERGCIKPVRALCTSILNNIYTQSTKYIVQILSKCTKSYVIYV